MLEGDGQGDLVGRGGLDDGGASLWTFAMVEESLVEAHHLWRRSPAVGHKPLRSCWPNDMLQRDTHLGDYDAHGGDRIAAEPMPLPLSRAEVARRDAVSAWIEWVPTSLNRRIVALATAQLARGDAQISWRKVARRVPTERGVWERNALSRRYERAIAAICAALNHPEAAAMVRAGASAQHITASTSMESYEARAFLRQLRG